MFLKRIELRGFKSFAGSKDIELGPGVTGIVGPNGSGKSNICDAIRWVLGEQSPRTLRGSSLQDVIFKGTQSRRKRSACEVSLVFDNADGGLGVPYSEVAVARSVNRAGESTFRINGVDCRLKDILTLFQNTGVGRDGYSIIGQGQISRILEHRAADRRGVFEEAAGVTKYRASQEEAERNLEKTRVNLDRMQDIMNELDEQAAPVREQMEQARTYGALMEELRRLEVTMLLRESEQATERENELSSEFEDVRRRIAECSAQVDAAAEATLGLEQELAEERDEIRQLQTALGEAERTAERCRGTAALAEERRRTAEGLLRDIDRRQAALSGTVENLNEDLRAAEEDERKAKQEAEDFATRLKERTAERKTSQKEHIDGCDMPDMRELRRQIEAAEVNVRDLRVRASGSLQGISAEEDALQRAKDRRAALEEDLERAESAAQKAASCFTRADKEARAAVSAAKSLVEEVRSEQAALRSASRDAAAAAAEQDVLDRTMRTYEGYYESVRSLMRDVRGNEALSAHVIGVVAECISASGELETAVETALGAGLQNVIVPTDSDARSLVGYLREKRYGRVTFLPSDALRIRYLNAQERRVLAEDGVLCAANEAVTCSDMARPAVDYLLGRTVIVRDLDTALRLKSAGKNSFRIVTTSGEIVVPGGAITGGSFGGRQKDFLARRRRADGAAKEAQRLRSIEEDLQRRTAQLEARLHGQEDRSRVLAEKARAARGQLEQCAKDAGTVRAAAERAKAEEKERTAHLAQLKKDHQGLEEQASAAEASLRTHKEALAAAEERLEEKRREETTAALAAADVRSEAAELRAKISGAQSRADAAAERIAYLKGAIRKARSDAEEDGTQRKQLEQARATADKEMSAATTDMNGRRNAAEELLRKIAAKTKHENELDTARKQQQERERRLSEEMQELQERSVRTEAAISRAKDSRAAALQRLWSDYELTAGRAESYRMDELERQKGRKRAAEIKAQIRELGPVNPRAEEDYHRLEARAEDLRAQLADLRQAEADLQAVIADLLDRMRVIFIERFTLINENFERVFRELFGGGQARIELAAGEDVMDAGIEIMAEPPGKRLQSLSLLSGGERTLTAIALCLAMLAVNPSPVCILDEIDAPLDDKNAVRLAGYLHRVSGTLQFIIITHRKTTMAVCDTLYGVSMPEKGVSDIVSVQLTGQGGG